MANNQRNHKFDPLDPFYSEEIDYETSGIRRSKANQLKRATSKPASAPIVHEKKKVSFFSRIKTFFEELPNRADRYRIYRMAVIIFASVVALSLLFAFTVAPWLDNQKQESEETKATDYSNEIVDLLEKDELNESKIYELEQKFTESKNNPEAQYEYAITLLDVYKANNDLNSIESIADQFLENPKLTFPTNARFLIKLQFIYYLMDEYDKYFETNEIILALPDDETYDFNSGTFTHYKNTLKKQLEEDRIEMGIE